MHDLHVAHPAHQAPRAARLADPVDARKLVRFATLAASDRAAAVDPDDHHLFVSLGCAVENLVIAARARGLVAVPALTSDGMIGIESAHHCLT